MGRTATYFGGHLIANSKVPVCSHGSLIFQGTDFRCHLYSVTTCWMLKSVCFLFGKDYEDHGTINVDVRRRKVQHYKDIVIEYIFYMAIFV